LKIVPNLGVERLAYRRDIDGLRAIAVLSVVAFHLFPAICKGGFVGVDIFFVISGFLISSIIYSELESGRFSIVEFYVRRIRRIYPALFLVLCFVCIAGWMLLLPSDFIALGKQIVGGSTFVANFVLWRQSGYFEQASSLKPLLHLWSLGVEEQYYLIFPLICLTLYRSRLRWILPAAFLAITAVSLFLNIAFVARYSAATFFLPFSRLWELFVGAGLALCLQRNLLAPAQISLIAKWKHGIGFLGFALLAGSIFGIDKSDEFPGWWALLPTIGAALLIAAGPTSWVNRGILSTRPAVFLGLISYPLYLWHWPILAFMRIANAEWGIDFSPVQVMALISAMFLLAYLTYRYVELPLRRINRRTGRRRLALALLGCVSLTGAFGAVVVWNSGFPARMPAALVAMDHDYASDASKLWRDRTCFLETDQYAASFKDDCLDAAEGHAPQPLVLVWGDSHAADLFSGFRAVQHGSGVRLAQFTSSLCAPILGLHERLRPACFSINNAVLDRIRLLKPDVVVLSAYWDFLDPDYDRATRADKLSHTIELIKAAGVPRVVVIGSAPFWAKTVPQLLLAELHHDPLDPVSNRLPRRFLLAHDDTLLQTTTQKAGAVYIPIVEDFCDQTSCVVTTGPGWKNVLIYDQSHVTGNGSTFIAQRIWATILPPGAITKLGGQPIGQAR
jgi:peptidoglycan/LPS O-acetylase OafA/YrhL